MKHQLILKVSDRMVSNKKRERNESGLIRMGAKARENLGLTSEKEVELWPVSSKISDRISRSKVLGIFEAYSSDLKAARESGISEDEFLRIGFVTKKTFDYICGGKQDDQNDIWIADTIEDTVIGADPEFLLQCEENVFKYAARVEGFHHSDTLGSDGPWAELRPTPAIKAEDLVKNIMSLLRDHPNTKLINKYDWISGCYYYGKDIDSGERDWPVGGHIHIGTPARLAKKVESSSSYRYKVFSCLKKVLDEYISIPMMRVEGVKNEVKRRQSFGSSSDMRLDHNRLEFRTLSGEWLTHPELAKLILNLSKAVSLAFFKILENANYDEKIITAERKGNTYEGSYFIQVDWKEVPIAKDLKSDRSYKELSSIIDKGNISFTKKYFQTLKEKFRSLETYGDYSDTIDKFMELIQMPIQDLKKIDRNLKHNWVGNKEFII